jgi:hypothetical protein
MGAADHLEFDMQLNNAGDVQLTVNGSVVAAILWDADTPEDPTLVVQDAHEQAVGVYRLRELGYDLPPTTVQRAERIRQLVYDWSQDTTGADVPVEAILAAAGGA